MSEASIIVNTRKPKVPQLKASGTTGSASCVHTISAKDLRIMQPIPGQGGFSLALKLKG